MTDYVDYDDGVAAIWVNFCHFLLSVPALQPLLLLTLPFVFSFHHPVSADLRQCVMALIVVALNYGYLLMLNERFQCGPHEMMTDLHCYARCPSVLTEL